MSLLNYNNFSGGEIGANLTSVVIVKKEKFEAFWSGLSWAKYSNYFHRTRAVRLYIVGFFVSVGFHLGVFCKINYFLAKDKLRIQRKGKIDGEI